MERSGEAYDRLISRVRDDLPDVAAEIEALIAEGRRIEASKLPVEERSDLNARLDPKLNRISKDDLITTPYTNDDRPRILVRALETLSRSMTSNREALDNFFVVANCKVSWSFAATTLLSRIARSLRR